MKEGKEESVTSADSSKGGLGQRERSLEGGRKQLEMLVLNDEFNIAGDLLVSARRGTDVTGGPCIDIEFNKAGGERFGKLTAKHLPQRNGAFAYRLGIIFDGQLYTAPVIQGVVSERVQIAGKFTKEEVDELVGLLKSGALPVKLKRIAAGDK